jgi:HTH-like domain
VAAIHAASQRSYGRPRIVRGLREQGIEVSHERVRNSLKRQELRPVYKRPYRVTTDSPPQTDRCQRAGSAFRWLGSQPGLGC